MKLLSIGIRNHNQLSYHSLKRFVKLRNFSAIPQINTYIVNNKNAVDYEKDLNKAADHLGRQQNHIWSKEEINQHLTTMYRHQPTTLSDRIMNSLVNLL
jgi:hypothetical protein